jgi:triosephosphate isomerase
MRKKIVAGNWKMNNTLHEAQILFSQLLEFQEEFPPNVNVIVCPPSIYLSGFSKKVMYVNNIDVAAQNCYFEQNGAYTGEISAEMIKSVGAEYCLIGHSERRALFGEDNSVLAQKVRAALEYDVKPIFCCGESLEQREKEAHFQAIKTQLEDSIFGLTKEEFEKIIVAYEPVWAIGTGLTATSAQAQEMHQYIREIISEKFGQEVADETTILYGGSCKPGNAAELFACEDVDGGLIGGASLKANSFLDIIKSMN